MMSLALPVAIDATRIYAIPPAFWFWITRVILRLLLPPWRLMVEKDRDLQRHSCDLNPNYIRLSSKESFDKASKRKATTIFSMTCTIWILFCRSILSSAVAPTKLLIVKY